MLRPRLLLLSCAALLALPMTAQAAPAESWYVAFPTNFKLQGTIVQDGATYSIDASAPWLEWVSYGAEPSGGALTSHGPVTGTWSANLPDVCSQSGTLDPATDRGGVTWGGTDGWYSTFHAVNGDAANGTFACLGPTELMNAVPLGSCGDVTYPHAVMLQPTFVIDETCAPAAPGTGSMYHRVEFAIRKVTADNAPIEGGAPIAKFITPRAMRATARSRTIRAQFRTTRAGKVRIEARVGDMVLVDRTYEVTAGTRSLPVQLPPLPQLRAMAGRRTVLPVTLYSHGGSVGRRQTIRVTLG